jgi:hypothetical protein
MWGQAVKTVNVSVRLDPSDNSPVLFFWNSNSRGLEWLECYARIGGHSECSIDYMRKCRPMSVHALTPDAVALVREWATLGPVSEHVNPRIVARLTRTRWHAC